jgi:hypothetical protein
MVEAVDDVERPVGVDIHPVRLVERNSQGRAAGTAVGLRFVRQAVREDGADIFVKAKTIEDIVALS